MVLGVVLHRAELLTIVRVFVSGSTSAASIGTAAALRIAAVNVPSDELGGITFDIARAVHVESTYPSVAVTQPLGRDSAPAVCSAESSGNTGDPVVDWRPAGAETPIRLVEGATRTGDMEISDDRSFTTDAALGRVSAPTPARDVTAQGRRDPVHA